MADASIVWRTYYEGYLEVQVWVFEVKYRSEDAVLVLVPPLSPSFSSIQTEVSLQRGFSQKYWSPEFLLSSGSIPLVWNCSPPKSRFLYLLLSPKLCTSVLYLLPQSLWSEQTEVFLFVFSARISLRMTRFDEHDGPRGWWLLSCYEKFIILLFTIWFLFCITDEGRRWFFRR